jgi:hypothetical protein
MIMSEKEVRYGATNLGALGEKAQKVAAVHAEHMQAQQDEQVALADALRAVVEVCRPALPAMSSKLRARGLPGGVRGIMLADDGYQCFILEDGRLGVVRPEGTRVGVDAAVVAGCFKVAVIVDALEEAMDAQLKGRAYERTVDIKGRIEKLRHVLRVIA